MGVTESAPAFVQSSRGKIKCFRNTRPAIVPSSICRPALLYTYFLVRAAADIDTPFCMRVLDEVAPRTVSVLDIYAIYDIPSLASLHEDVWVIIAGDEGMEFHAKYVRIYFQ